MKVRHKSFSQSLPSSDSCLLMHVEQKQEPWAYSASILRE